MEPFISTFLHPKSIWLKTGNLETLKTKREKKNLGWQFSSSGWHGGCYPKGGPLRHLFPVAYARITAPGVTKCFSCLPTWWRARGKKTQSSHGIQIMSKGWLTSGWFLTVIEITAMSHCQGQINNIPSIIWKHLGEKNRWPKPLICSDALTITTHVLIKPWAALIT